MNTYYIYIFANEKNGTIYTGVTNDLARRTEQHKDKKTQGFTSKYKLSRLVYYEQTESVEAAISREKQLKNWKREWKLELIEKNNPGWEDLTQGLFLDSGSSPE